MRKLILGFVFGAISFGAIAASNSVFSTVRDFETRNTGSHALYLNSGVPTTEGCDYNDRGVVVDGDAGTKTMTAMILYAMSNSKQVQIRVDGCTPLAPGASSLTAPKVVKVQVLN